MRSALDADAGRGTLRRMHCSACWRRHPGHGPGCPRGSRALVGQVVSTTAPASALLLPEQQTTTRGASGRAGRAVGGCRAARPRCRAPPVPHAPAAVLPHAPARPRHAAGPGHRSGPRTRRHCGRITHCERRRRINVMGARGGGVGCARRSLSTGPPNKARAQKNEVRRPPGRQHARPPAPSRLPRHRLILDPPV